MKLSTSNLDGSNFSGSGKISGLWWMFLKSGNTFHPFGMRYPKIDRHDTTDIRKIVRENKQKKNDKVQFFLVIKEYIERDKKTDFKSY